MITGRNVVIIGAGASKEYGFPLGTELYQKVHNGEYYKLYEDFLQSTTISAEKKNRYLRQAEDLAFHVKNAKNRSIDYFLSNNPSFYDRGREAISLLMLKHEAESIEIANNLEAGNDWLSTLFLKSVDFFRYSDDFSGGNSISFITFNYERSLEYFLQQKLIHSFVEVSRYDLERNLRRIPIHHVYGKIGRLEWQREREYGELGYGWDYRSILLENIRDSINVMYANRYGVQQEDLAELIESADKIFFLGFAYDPNNLTALGFTNIISLQTRGKKIYGTAIGTHEKMLNELKELWGKNHEVHLRDDMNCCMLLEEFLN